MGANCCRNGTKTKPLTNGVCKDFHCKIDTLSILQIILLSLTGIFCLFMRIKLEDIVFRLGAQILNYIHIFHKKMRFLFF